MRKIFITIGMAANDSHIGLLENVKRIDVGTILSNTNFSILTNSNEDKLKLIIEEILIETQDILVGYACYNMEEIFYILNKLQENNQQLHTVFIPSPERLLRGKEEELEFANKHANWASFSPSQIEEGYQEWQKIYEEIKQELPKYSIEVKEV
jgi:hypothetical protein